MLTENDLTLLRKLCSEYSEVPYVFQKYMDDQTEPLRRAIHDMRNPLTALSSSLQLLEYANPDLSSLPAWHLVKSDIQDLLDSFSRLNQICGGIGSLPSENPK